MPIVPDEKDWTWVLGRECPDCRFDAGVCVASEVPLLVRENADVWRALLADGLIRHGRPDDATWSTLEYACYVRDVYRRYRGRIDLMLSEDDPLFPNWDQDASAIQDSYDAQDAATVVDDLATAAEALAVQLDGVGRSDWERQKRVSPGSVPAPQSAQLALPARRAFCPTSPSTATNLKSRKTRSARAERTTRSGRRNGKTMINRLGHSRRTNFHRAVVRASRTTYSKAKAA